jgi:hypothetical protein
MGEDNTMRKTTNRLTTLMVVVFLYFPHSLAQVNSFCAAHASTLFCHIPSLFGEPTVNPLQPFNQALATQLTLVPLASPASGIVYMKSPATKLPVPSGTETFGPVLTERGETLYTKKLFIAATYQRFRFNSLDGVNLKKIPIIFDYCTAAGQCSPFATIIRTEAHLDQYALFATFGVTPWLDASVALPIVKVTLSANGVSCSEPYCKFIAGDQQVDFEPLKVAGSATGIGDVLLRAKAGLFESKKFRFAAGCDLRLPSGDTLNFLGAGSVGVKPFEAFSRSGRLSPHLNIAYQWNGDSLLAGAVPGQKGKMPEVLSYSLGADFAALKKLTVSVDFLGEHVLNASRLEQITTLNLPNTTTSQGNFETARGALGFKWNPVKELLVAGNILAKFDHNGLHHTAVPLLGVSYTF